MKLDKLNTTLSEDEVMTADSKELDKVIERIDKKAATVDHIKRREGLVTVKPAKTYKRGEGNTHGVSVLPGAWKVYGTRTGPNGEYITGLTQKEFEQLEIANSEGVSFKEFYKNYNVRLGDMAKTLNLAYERDYIEYRFLLELPEVANTPEERSSSTPFIMYDEEAEAAKITKKSESKFEAFEMMMKMTAEEKADFLKLFGYVTKNMSEVVVKAKLAAVIEKDPKDFIAKFSRKDKADRILLASLAQFEILNKRVGGSYYFGEDLVGITEDIAVDYLRSPRNQEMKMNWIAMLQEKTLMR